ncbi:MAG: TIGR02281 family clan AA aspartic protease [bacterium]|nr:TIGR02281 family clan AA aspartic protease [bacterium]
MRCPKCKVNNKPNANFCISCGISFKSKDKLKIQHPIWIVLLLIVILCLVVFLTSSLYTLPGNNKQTSSVIKDISSKSNLSSKQRTITNYPSKIKTHKSREKVNKNIIKKEEPSNLLTLKQYSEKLLKNSDEPKNLIVGKLEKLSAINISRGHAKEVADILTINVIAVSESSKLLKYAVDSRLKVYGYGNALKLIENLKYSPFLSNILHNKLADMTNTVYIDWINNLLNKNSINDSLEVYNFAVKNTRADSNLLILGAVIYLKKNNWQQADSIVNIIKSGNYNIPNGFASVEEQIKYFKSIEGKIVLRFRPGSNYIPAEALLDGEVNQKFIVDTGASLVTIPKATAEKLDLKYPSDNRTRRVATAGGTVYAKEVIIASMTINNKTVNNIPALIMDLPSHSTLGLLGLSFLNMFHIQLNNSKGEMILTPK